MPFAILTFSLRFVFKSPVLDNSRWKEEAQKQGLDLIYSYDHKLGDVVTRSLLVLPSYKGPHPPILTHNKRSLDELAKEVMPCVEEARGAIDVSTGEFLIFRPKTLVHYGVRS